MGGINKVDRPADLLKRMADTVHADIWPALKRGTLQEKDIHRAIFTCMGCNAATECPFWMDAHETGSDRAPDFCGNRDWLARLAD